MKKLLFLLSIMLVITSCRAKKNIEHYETEKIDTKELVILPSIESKGIELIVQDGVIVDIKEKLQWNDSAVVAEVEIKNNKMDFSLIQQDTITIEKVVTKEKIVLDKVTETKYKTPKWGWWSLGINLLILLLVVLRIYIKSVSGGIL